MCKASKAFLRRVRGPGTSPSGALRKSLSAFCFAILVGRRVVTQVAHHPFDIALASDASIVRMAGNLLRTLMRCAPDDSSRRAIGSIYSDGDRRMFSRSGVSIFIGHGFRNIAGGENSSNTPTPSIQNEHV